MPNDLSADFVIIGSGIIGSLMAQKFAQAGASVIILEAGPRVTRGELVARFRNSPRRSDWMSPYPSVPSAPHPIYQPTKNNYFMQAGPYPYEAEYIRQVGGTTWHWAAQAWRNVPSDFKIHSLYGVGVDWPFSYDDLEPYYQEAEEIMGVSGAPNTGSPRNKPFPMEPVTEPYAMQRLRERLDPVYAVVSNTTARNSRSYDGRPACCGNNSCQPICPIDAQYHGGIAAASAEAAGAKLIANANVYKLEHDEKGRVTAALYYDPDKNSHRVTGKTFIVAANGIESPRLLLLSASDKFPKGLANNHEMVGRHLMDHPSTSLTFDAEEDLWLGRGPQSPSSINTMRDGSFRSEHAAYRLDFTNISRVDSTTQSLIAAGVYGVEFEKRLRYSAAHELNVKNVLEVLPDPENRVTLGNEKDSMGIPKPQAHYAIHDYTRKGHERSQEDFKRIAELMGGSNLRFSKEGVFANNQHICGTLSMGTDLNVSVCDQWGRTHDHENLYCAGTGLLPTAATCNSTETGLAVALRTVHHILAEQNKAPAPSAATNSTSERQPT
ncbi:GMC family oxidoreductase [Herminiimonas arsenitoxidans]|uniref:GMC family oxidoreductase n=1 Tax=Herminiimonas arsenitoxidans TaxID=1809410 RepID=UPI000970C8EF|nr:GMC family oxidoreductase [Herminiimonas arsenitoxidans]